MLEITRKCLCVRVVGRPRLFGAAVVLGVVAVLSMPCDAFAQGGGGGGGPGDTSPEQAIREMQDQALRQQLRAREAQQHQQRTAAQAQTGDAQPVEPRFDLRFEGGTVADYLEAIQEASGRRNIVAMAGTERVPMPRVVLDSVNTQAAVTVLSGMIVEIESSVYAQVSVNTRLDVATVSVDFSRLQRDRVAAVNPPQRDTAVHGLAEMLLNGGYTIDAILSAIDVALAMSGDSDAKLRYHEETRMLFVYGTGQEHATVRNVLEELSIQAVMMPKEEMSEVDMTGSLIATWDSAIERERRTLDVLQGVSQHAIVIRIEELRHEIEELEAKILQGEERPASREELAIRFRALERAMIENEQVETRIRDSRSRLSEAISQREALQKKSSEARQP